MSAGALAGTIEVPVVNKGQVLYLHTEVGTVPRAEGEKPWRVIMAIGGAGALVVEKQEPDGGWTCYEVGMRPLAEAIVKLIEKGG